MTSREELADGARYLPKGGSAAGSAARRRNDTAMERRGAQVLRVMESRAPRGAIQVSASRRSIPSACPRGGRGRQATPGL